MCTLKKQHLLNVDMSWLQRWTHTSFFSVQQARKSSGRNFTPIPNHHLHTWHRTTRDVGHLVALVYGELQIQQQAVDSVELELPQAEEPFAELELPQVELALQVS